MPEVLTREQVLEIKALRQREIAAFISLGSEQHVPLLCDGYLALLDELAANSRAVAANDSADSARWRETLAEVERMRQRVAELERGVDAYCDIIDHVQERERAAQDESRRLRVQLQRNRRGYLNILEVRKIAGTDRYGALTRDEVEQVVAEVDAALAASHDTAECECCGEPATRKSADGVPLCEGDYQELVRQASPDTEQATALTTPEQEQAPRSIPCPLCKGEGVAIRVDSIRVEGGRIVEETNPREATCMVCNGAGTVQEQPK